MQRLAIVCILAGISITAANAQVQRNYGTTGGVGGSPYGSSGYGASPYGSANGYGGAQTPFGSTTSPGTANFTGGSTTTTNDSAAPSATTNSTDYERVMNSINSSTGDSDNTVTPPVASIPGEIATPPIGGGYGSPMISGGIGNGGPTGAGGLPGSNGTFTSPSGNTGLGEYNSSPYAKGEASSTADPAPGPGTPVYNGYQYWAMISTLK